jgi:hypothetical protein
MKINLLFIKRTSFLWNSKIVNTFCTNHLKALSFAFIVLLSINDAIAQLHTAPTCGENYTLDWSTSPTASNEYAWPAGSLSNTFTDVDDSGIDVSVSFTGDTNTLGYWSTNLTPEVGNSSSTLYEGLDFITNGFSDTGITCTINFSSPIYALSFDIHHVNKSFENGDKYWVSATTSTGDTIYPTFTSSSNPSYVVNNAEGTIDATGSSTYNNDAVVGVNFSDSDYITSVTFLWKDCSTCSNYYVHGSGLGNFSFCIPQTLDFDGDNDFINRAAFLGNKSEATMMSWIKLDSGFDGGEIMGQRNFRLFIDSNRRLRTYVKTNGASLNNIATPVSEAPVLETDMWYHVAVIYDADNTSVKMYLNGELEWKYSILYGNALNNEASYNSDHDFEIGRNTLHDNDYFEGSIYETRVYKKALTDNELQRQIYQEIENNDGKVRGKVIPKDIEGLLWSDLELYYKMDIINTGKTPDNSSFGVDGNLNNMRTYQERTAPLPYVTKTGGNGNWNHKDNWLHGDVWDIADAHTPCAIVKISDDMVSDINHSTVGLIIDDGKELTVNSDSGIFNSWFLELNGKIDLQGESQLIQTKDSELVVGVNGELEKDQQGTKDLYTYNYWSSPVGVSSMVDNTVSFKYKLPNVMMNGTNPNSPNSISFVGGYDGSVSGSNISIASYWIWKFANRPDDDYSSWQHVRNTVDVNPGEGFTMKGVSNTNGSVSQEQNYVFNGKPNNGDINLDLNANNDYLVGNPYPSAIDAQQFILDNGPTIDGTGNTTGTLYFWEHWGGGSHYLAEYQGGYATYNLSGGVPAASKASADPDVEQSSMVGTKTPGRYIPVGQGFFVVGEATGKINFNNGQRSFIKESGSSSVFMRGTTNTNTNDSEINEDSRIKIRLGLNSVNTMHRQLLLTVDDRATMGYDWGFDGALNEVIMDDMYWMIDNDKYVIQGIDEIDESQTILPLGIKTSSDGINSIKIDGLENVPEYLDILLYDNVTEVYNDLRVADYSLELLTGEYLERFSLVFSVQGSLSVTDVELESLSLYYALNRNNIVILNPRNAELKQIELFNITGQSVYVNEKLWKGSYNEYKIENLNTGTYVVKLSTVDNNTITKKIIIK